MNTILVTPLRRISVPRGDILRAIRDGDPGFVGFGEAYFTSVDHGAVKGWKRHRRMTMNLIVIVGTVEFVFVDDRDGEPTYQRLTLSPDSEDSYARITVPPGIWTAFAGRAVGQNMLLNFADIVHDPDEADNRPLDAFAWEAD